MTRGYVTPGGAGLLVFITGSVIGIALITAAFFAEYYYSQKADTQHIGREHNMCEIKVTVSCENNDICRYRTSVPCADLDTLTNASKGDK